mmetsp:Transcript_81556/g.264221  ORF Transcript_81556/g.264221 Transcript_81556/m.264221 type:complete len:509 (+) Transcript_81556:3-1529(+)
MVAMAWVPGGHRLPGVMTAKLRPRHYGGLLALACGASAVWTPGRRRAPEDGDGADVMQQVSWGEPLDMPEEGGLAPEPAPPGAFRQRLYNFHDLQYFAVMQVGDQRIRGIVDTGSFELVVFSTACSTCGVAPAYSEKLSPSFQSGTVQEEHVYGSGSCITQDGRDQVVIGPLSAKQQAIWMATSCRMPLLDRAAFNAIIGVGPPGQQEYAYQKMLTDLDNLRPRNADRSANDRLEQERKRIQQQFAVVRDRTSILQSFGVRTFSTCFGREPNSPAWIVWNDTNPKGFPGVTSVPVVGNLMWTVQVYDVGFSQVNGPDVSLGCETGCGAIVDTGTSLLGVPGDMLQAVRRTVTNSDFDCSDLSQFPDLVMTLGGTRLRLPPDAYIGTLFGFTGSQLHSLLHMTSATPSSVVQCQLLLMDLGTEFTQFGPLLILGMPFFREYYTTFDTGKDHGNRTVFVTPADEQCQPARQAKQSGQVFRRHRRAMKPRRVDASMVRMPEWLPQRRGVDV